MPINIIASRKKNFRKGLTFTEILGVVVIIGLFVMMVQINFSTLLNRSRARAQIQQMVSTMQMVANAAGQSNSRYEVIIDLNEQSLLLREITNPDLSVVLDEEIISQEYLSDRCRIAFVEFDDGEYTNQGQAKFRAGRTGWAYGGKIVVMDERENLYSIVVNRLSRIIRLEEGDARLLEPKFKEDVIF